MKHVFDDNIFGKIQAGQHLTDSAFTSPEITNVMKTVSGSGMDRESVYRHGFMHGIIHAMTLIEQGHLNYFRKNERIGNIHERN